MKQITIIFIILAIGMSLVFCDSPKEKKKIEWKHISSVTGDLEVPNPGAQQTASIICDVDKDGSMDFIISERSAAPSVVWYRNTAEGWKRYVVDNDSLRIEAGSAFSDIDGDGDIDIVFAGDGSDINVWWWENPNPEFDPDTPWIRRNIKNSGEKKQHDQLFGDFDGDGQDELVFWNQGAASLMFAEIPENVKNTEPWDYVPIYTYPRDKETPPRGLYPGWQGINTHEGLWAEDIDLDGVTDIVGGGLWFKHVEGSTFEAHEFEPAYHFSRSASGQFIEGGRPEIILVVGDGRGPMIMYEWKNDQWFDTVLIDSVQDGHTIDVIDFNGDGHLDIFVAEMQLGDYTDGKVRILYGDGKGSFTEYIALSGYGLHESRIVDLDGDGDYDILGKPYNWDAPRLDIWLQQ